MIRSEHAVASYRPPSVAETSRLGWPVSHKNPGLGDFSRNCNKPITEGRSPLQRSRG